MRFTSIIGLALVIMTVSCLNRTTAFPGSVSDHVDVAANTLYDQLPEDLDLLGRETYRVKRATCDLASGFGVGHSLCAAHCLARRRRGGYCNKKRVCICRN